MVKVRARRENGRLYFDFRWRGRRYREQTALPDTAANRRRLEATARRMSAEMTLGTFDPAAWFPDSPASRGAGAEVEVEPGGESLAAFVERWWRHHQVEWRASTRETQRSALDRHILPRLGDKPVCALTRADLLEFRQALALSPGRSGPHLHPKSVNNVMALLNVILAEVAVEYELPNPGTGLKRLKVAKTDIKPFSLGEVGRILAAVRLDYRDYLQVRFFTGLRSGEVHGLRWRHVDFSAREVLVRETFARGRTDYTKTDGSQRSVAMSEPVLEALRRQREATGHLDHVFCTGGGGPIDNKNFTDRVWYPLLDHLGLERRRPYNMRHTCATLWLAAGESPEWIANQLGHASTEMLFKVYSRFIPNNTRRDGSAFDRMINGLFVETAVRTGANR